MKRLRMAEVRKIAGGHEIAAMTKEQAAQQLATRLLMLKRENRILCNKNHQLKDHNAALSRLLGEYNEQIGRMELEKITPAID